ncbi:MAG: efflux RND transporter periplasmic adaptor subunit [Candidatus Hinthialibacter antarcticus]|nr:efflux RND transporter periplasmic adaptor subunit [Candidatus Hinthialibacter antarcticus]
MFNLLTRRYVCAASIFFLTFSLVAIAQPPDMPVMIPSVRADAVRMEDVQERRQITGDLRAKFRSQVAALEEGRLVKILADEADVVKKGDLIARIDDRRLKAQLDGLEAQRQITLAQNEARRAELKNAQWNLNRLKPLWDKKLTTEQELENANMLVQVKEAEVLAGERTLIQIKSSIDLLKIRLEETRIDAPFDGVIIERNAELGEWITPGNLVVTMISTGTIEAWLEAPERIAYLFQKEGGDVQIEISASGQSLEPKEVRIIPQVDPRVRTMFIVADLEMDANHLAPGMSVTASLPTGERKTRMTVSKDAIMHQETGFFVYKAQQSEDGYIASPAPITRLFTTGDRVAIESPALAESDLVIVEGNERLFPMSPISLIGQTDAE